MRRAVVVLVSIVSLLNGCAAWTTPTPLDQPYFRVDSAEGKTFQALARKQEALAAKCQETNSCDHVYFTRALLGLFESREVAEQYFRKVLVIAPKSHLAYSSQAWIQLLQKHPAPESKSWPEAIFTAPSLADSNASLGRTVDRLVRDLLYREVVIQQLRSSKDGDFQTVETLQRELADRERKIEALTLRRDGGKPVPEPAAMHTLQKQLSDRDKKIEELSTQLEALKRIDQEMREKVRPIRPPSVPAPDATP
jgi:tetratricopeptide (TPR) repeat protein